MGRCRGMKIGSALLVAVSCTLGFIGCGILSALLLPSDAELEAQFTRERAVLKRIVEEAGVCDDITLLLLDEEKYRLRDEEAGSGRPKFHRASDLGERWLSLRANMKQVGVSSIGCFPDEGALLVRGRVGSISHMIEKGYMWRGAEGSGFCQEVMGALEPVRDYEDGCYYRRLDDEWSIVLYMY